MKCLVIIFACSDISCNPRSPTSMVLVHCAVVVKIHMVPVNECYPTQNRSESSSAWNT